VLLRTGESNRRGVEHIDAFENVRRSLSASANNLAAQTVGVVKARDEELRRRLCQNACRAFLSKKERKKKENMFCNSP